MREHVATRPPDAIFLDDNQPPRVGQKILSSSHVGSPRWYNARFLDGMAIVKKYKKPTYFITMTCNPHWQEIVDNLGPGQTAQNRPDLVARVFNMKKTQLMHDLTNGSIFGRTVAHMHVIEYQKRGLPHVHILLILAEEDDIHNVEDVDRVICAELPPDPNEPGISKEEKEQRSRLEEIVVTNMIHGPCGTLFPTADCMKDGKCKKFFPKPFQSTTVVDANATYASYRRRCPSDGGRTIQVTRKGITYTADNSMVVPYNPVLLLRYKCHINVEKCASILGAKYIYKYTTKGPDRAMVSVEVEDGAPRDEVQNYKDMRCVGSCEAAARLYGFSIAKQYPPVKELRVHLKDDQTVYFEEGNEAAVVAGCRHTELDAFFKLNKTLQEKNVPIEDMPMYVDVPETYTWESKPKVWKERVNKKVFQLGRIHTVPHTAGDVFYLRMLLNHEHSRGKTDFDDMLTLPSGQCETYKQVCEKLGLLQDDGEWIEILTESALTMSSKKLRNLYFMIIVWSAPANPRQLFDKFWHDWADDFLQRAQHKNVNFTEDQLRTMVLLDLKNQLFDVEKQLQDFGLHEPTEQELAAVTVLTGSMSSVIMEEMNFDVAELAEEAQQILGMYTEEQQAVHNRILDAIKNDNRLALYINAKGGCGKTFLLNGILKAVRSLEGGGCVALAMATTGIAAMLLEKGRTFHSRMKAPLNPDDTSTLRIPAQSELAKLVKMAKLLVIDEATMLDNRQLGALDRTLQDIMQCQEPFGGKVVVLAGDMRQCLVVVPGASRAGIVERTVNQCPLWDHFEVMELTRNMRVLTSGDERLIAWDDLTTSIGNGTCGTSEVGGDVVSFPEEMCLKIEQNTAEDNNRESKSMTELIKRVFPDLKDNIKDPDWLTGRAILTPTNKAVDAINDIVVATIPGPSQKLYSADSVDDVRDSRGFSVEYINSLNPNGIPRHCIELKKGVPVMLLRNLQPSQGLCNGTRLIFQSVSNNGRVLMCSYKHNGITKETALPRIVLKPQTNEFPFDWSRRQFPLRVAFACTINKSQGQTMKRIGLWLPSPVFGHGQLYVAVSRVGDPANITIAMKPTTDLPVNSTRNVVFKEVLMGCVAGAQTTTPVSEDSPMDSVPEFEFEEDEGDWPDMDDYDIIEDVAGDGFLLEEYS